MSDIEKRQNRNLFTLKKNGTSAAIVLFTIFFIISNALHPNLFSPSMHHTVDYVVNRIKDNPWLHFAHFLEWVSALLLIVLAFHMMKRIRGRARWFGLIGGVCAIIGSVILATSKGALCFTLSAFDTLNKLRIQVIGTSISGSNPPIPAIKRVCSVIYFLCFLIK